MTDVSGERYVCDAEVDFTDFDGTPASAPCGRPATRRLVLDDEQGKDYIEAVGGWDEYRAHALWDDPTFDPGPDPGREKWGHVPVLTCDEHYALLVDDIASGAMLGVTIISDEPVEGR